MKIELPLPNEEKPIYVPKEVVIKLPVPFCYAGALTQADIDYFENTIKMHKLYRTVRENQLRIYRRASYLVGGYRNENNDFRSLITLIQFYKQFVNDKKCPKRLRNFLDKYVVMMNQNVEQFCSPKTIAEKNFLMESWARTCH